MGFLSKVKKKVKKAASSVSDTYTKAVDTLDSSRVGQVVHQTARVAAETYGGPYAVLAEGVGTAIKQGDASAGLDLVKSRYKERVGAAKEFFSGDYKALGARVSGTTGGSREEQDRIAGMIGAGQTAYNTGSAVLETYENRGGTMGLVDDFKSGIEKRVDQAKGKLEDATKAAEALKDRGLGIADEVLGADAASIIESKTAGLRSIVGRGKVTLAGMKSARGNILRGAGAKLSAGITSDAPQQERTSRLGTKPKGGIIDSILSIFGL